MFFVRFPHMDYIFIFAHKLYITTIWEHALSSWGDSLSRVLYSLLILYWSHQGPCTSPLPSISWAVTPSPPKTHATLPLLPSTSRSTKPALILYTGHISEAGFIYEEEKDFNVERTGLVSSLTHTIKMSQTFFLLGSLWNLQNCLNKWKWADNYGIIHEVRREHIQNNPNLKGQVICMFGLEFVKVDTCMMLLL